MTEAISERLYRRIYSRGAINGTAVFYGWIRENVDPKSRVLNVGAGPPTQNPLRTLRGEVAELAGADIDAVVLQNSELDRAKVIEGGRIDEPDEYFDVVFADFVLEHVEKPREFLLEILRVLRVGGSFFFRTPNRYHYVTAVSAITPHWFHRKIANAARGLSQDAHEPWPTYYRMNTRHRLRRLANEVGFSTSETRLIEPEPAYTRRNIVLLGAGFLYERIVNSTDLMSGLRVNILGRFSK